MIARFRIGFISLVLTGCGAAASQTVGAPGAPEQEAVPTSEAPAPSSPPSTAPAAPAPEETAPGTDEAAPEPPEAPSAPAPSQDLTDDPDEDAAHQEGQP